MTAISVAVAAIRNGRGEYLITRRPDHVHQGGLWEFPGGKFEPGEDLQGALRRELREELGIDVRGFRPLIRIDHDYGDRQVSLRVCLVDAFAGEPHGREGQPLRWVTAQALSEFDFPAANRPIVTALQLPDRCLITPDPSDETAAFLERLEMRLRAGDIRLLQLRAPSLSQERLLRLAEKVMPLARFMDVRVMVNGDPEVALAAGAHGVHLNGRRLSRREGGATPEGLMLSASVHDAHELSLARRAGVDFAFVSPVLPTPSHPGAKVLGWDGFAALADSAGVPVYALGGVGPGDVEQAQARGGQGISAIRGLWNMGASPS